MEIMFGELVTDDHSYQYFLSQNGYLCMLVEETSYGNAVDMTNGILLRFGDDDIVQPVKIDLRPIAYMRGKNEA